MIQSLPTLEIQGHHPTTSGNANHPIRHMTRRAAGLEVGAWDSEARQAVTDVFDSLAPEWHTRTSPLRTRVVTDALERGLDGFHQGGGLALELGSGIGTYSRLIASRFERTLSVDLSHEMLKLAPSDTTRVAADASALPVAAGSAAAVVLINAFFFPSEVERVLQSGGLVVWVNSSGPDTPIHLSTTDLVEAAPFPVDGVEARAGAGTWCVLRRLQEPGREQ